MPAVQNLDTMIIIIIHFITNRARRWLFIKLWYCNMHKIVSANSFPNFHNVMLIKFRINNRHNEGRNGTGCYGNRVL